MTDINKIVDQLASGESQEVVTLTDAQLQALAEHFSALSYGNEDIVIMRKVLAAFKNMCDNNFEQWEQFRKYVIHCGAYQKTMPWADGRDAIQKFGVK
jgi:hypothetical protein